MQNFLYDEAFEEGIDVGFYSNDRSSPQPLQLIRMCTFQRAELQYTHTIQATILVPKRFGGLDRSPVSNEEIGLPGSDHGTDFGKVTRPFSGKNIHCRLWRWVSKFKLSFSHPSLPSPCC